MGLMEGVMACRNKSSGGNMNLKLHTEILPGQPSHRYPRKKNMWFCNIRNHVPRFRTRYLFYLYDSDGVHNISNTIPTRLTLQLHQLFNLNSVSIWSGLLILILFTALQTTTAQPENWLSPIDGPVLLSGTFGELRGNHYHAGIDIKPNVSGHQEIIAVADGYVKEIRVRGGSYGNALLIQHNDGYQSLYGHLDHFNPDLDAMVYQYQYEQEQFEITISLDSTEYPVTQGTVLATMGNTGYSFGRHLHFEVRHHSGTMYNPLLVIPQLQDNTAPQFRNLKINYHDDPGREYKEKIVSVRSLGGSRYDAGDLVLNAFKYSLAVDVVDLHRKTHNRNGVYSLELFRDSTLIYQSVFDSLSRTDRKFYPAYVDYIASTASQTSYYNLRYSNNLMEISLSNSKLGLMRPYPFSRQEYSIVATDFQGNSSTLTFSIRQSENPSIDYAHMYNYMIPANQSSRINLDRYSLLFPPGTFLTDQRVYIFEEEVVENNEKIYLIHMLGEQSPLYEKPLLTMSSDLTLAEKSQWTLARCSGKGFKAITTIREENQFAARIGQLSDYCLVKDSLPPEIRFLPQNSQKWYFTVKDNMHSFSQMNFSATVDGEWTLLKADNKKDRLIFEDFNRYRDGKEHLFTLTVKDGCGNIKVHEQSFN